MVIITLYQKNISILVVEILFSAIIVRMDKLDIRESTIAWKIEIIVLLLLIVNNFTCTNYNH